ncbi:VIT1/CCC1 family predicted Fe2+/Mn2+ transporter [Arthrobacter sp. AZCC_0090]|nr:VIT1/CCC1 family predicted Fe2+/Mn2+ transporter [Arthrobacter sp. AZCC_0090]
MDRNWNELLQELRVLQTGVQIIGGFLLTLPFQQRFGTLTELEKWLYLVLVVLATMTTGLMLVPVSLHRRLFQHHVKSRLVAAGDKIVKSVLACVALLIAGCAWLIFSVVLGPEAGTAAGASILLALAALVLLYPLLSWSPKYSRLEPKSGTGSDNQSP